MFNSAISWTAACLVPLISAISQSLLNFLFIESVMSSNHLILLPSSPSDLNLSPHQGLFQWIGSLHPMVKLLELQLQHQSCQWIFRLVSLTIDLFDFLAIQGTLKSLLPHHYLKASILWCSVFFYGWTLTSVHDYWKNHSFDYMDLCQQSYVCVFNRLTRFVIAFLPRRQCLLISWLQSPSAVILEPKKIKSATTSAFPLLFAWSDGTGCHDLHFLNVDFQASSFTFIFHTHQEAL